MVLNKKVIIWDLDNTLYRITPEFADMLDGAMACALVEDLGVPMSLEECKEKVKESYKVFRDGGEYFFQNYGIKPKDLFDTYFNHKPVEKIIPYEHLSEELTKLDADQYIFTASNRMASEKILKQIGLFELFDGKFYSVEDFGVYKKNESSDVYKEFCKKINQDPNDCLFVDDSYSNLEFAKEAGMTTVRLYYNQNSAKDKDYIDYAFKGIQGFLDEVA